MVAAYERQRGRWLRGRRFLGSECSAHSAPVEQRVARSTGPLDGGWTCRPMDQHPGDPPRNTDPQSQVFDRAAELSQQAIPGAAAVSVILLEGERARSAAFTSGAAARLGERQYEAGFGPCMDAARTGTKIVISDTATDQTYPEPLTGFGARHGRWWRSSHATSTEALPRCNGRWRLSQRSSRSRRPTPLHAE